MADQILSSDPIAGLGVETRLVRGGLTRSNHGETSEAIFMTSGFVYDDAASAEARFAGEQPGFMYSRYANPTIEMFERRMALLEGAEVCHATASGRAVDLEGGLHRLADGGLIVELEAIAGGPAAAGVVAVPQPALLAAVSAAVRGACAAVGEAPRTRRRGPAARPAGSRRWSWQGRCSADRATAALPAPAVLDRPQRRC